MKSFAITVLAAAAWQTSSVHATGGYDPYRIQASKHRSYLVHATEDGPYSDFDYTQAYYNNDQSVNLSHEEV